jgi:hypothetical protein
MLTFEPLTLERQEIYQNRLARCASIASDYSFINLWGWREHYDLQWAFGDQLVWILQREPQPVLWAPVGDWHDVDWAAELTAVKQLTDRVIRVPERLLEIVQHARHDDIQVTDTRGQWDYLYRKHDLVELKGNRFHKKKNLVNQFIKNYDYHYVPFGEDMVDQALAMQEDWCVWRDCESHETLAAENKVIEKVLRDWRALRGLAGGALRVDGKLVAYTIGETMADQSLVVHFEKGDPEYKGSYQAINKLFLENMPDSFQVVNREQDLDDDGLRKAKLSYNPYDFIRKYQFEF